MISTTTIQRSFHSHKDFRKERKKKEQTQMYTFKNTNLVHVLLFNLILHACIITAEVQPATISFCGKIKLQTPFSYQNSQASSSPLRKLLVCKSDKLYFKTTVGLLQVSSIDYSAKTLTISHTSCSSSVHFISPSLLSAGFPAPPQPNSLLLFNCLGKREAMPPFMQNCTSFYGCNALSEKQDNSSSCWIVHDSAELEMGFSPKNLNCSYYKRVYRETAFNSTSFREGFKLGTVISYDIPDHIPSVCEECAKAQGNCGAGLRCICHPKECRDKVISRGEHTWASEDFIMTFILSIIVITFFI